jgi:hypothetical protein
LLLIAGVIVLGLVFRDRLSQPRLDTSSKAAFDASLLRLNSKLDEEEQQVLRAAIATMASEEAMKELLKQDADEDESQAPRDVKKLFESIDGLTAREIIALARAKRASERATQ